MTPPKPRCTLTDLEYDGPWKEEDEYGNVVKVNPGRLKLRFLADELPGRDAIKAAVDEFFDRVLGSPE